MERGNYPPFPSPAEVSKWCIFHQPTRQTDVVITGIELTKLEELLTFSGSLSSSLFVALYSIIEGRRKLWRESIINEVELCTDETISSDLVISMHETISDGMLSRRRTPFAWIHMGHGGYCELDGATLSDGTEELGTFLETEKIASAIAAMKGVCSFIILPVCHSSYSATILQDLENVLYVHGTAAATVGLHDPQISGFLTEIIRWGKREIIE